MHDPVTWHGINYTGTQITQWYFQNKGKSGWTGTSSFVLEVSLCNLRPSVIYSVPCDRIVQRAHSVILSSFDIQKFKVSTFSRFLAQKKRVNVPERKSFLALKAAVQNNVYLMPAKSRFCNNPNPSLMLTLGLSSTLRYCFRPKYYIKTMLSPKTSITKGVSLFQCW